MFRPSTLSVLTIALVLLAGPAVLAAQGPSAEAAEPWWGWVLLGRTHPFIVHFPVGLLLAGVCVEVVQRLRGRRVPSDVGLFCLTAGLAGGALAVWFGTLNAGHQSITGESAEILSRHQVAGWIVLAAGVAAWLAGRAALTGASWASPAYLGLFLVAGGAVGATGHFGGQLVYGSTYVTSVLPWNKTSTAVARAAPPPAAAVPDTPTTSPPAADEPTSGPADEPTDRQADLPASRPADWPASGQADPPASRPADEPTSRQADPPASRSADPPVLASVAFSRDVEPLLRATCVECHGPDKVKGRLRMDSVEALKAGGKSGPLVEPGNPEQSLMMRRVLGLDGEDQMPLDADPLTPEQIEVLRRWIAEGARFDTTPAVADATRPQG